MVPIPLSTPNTEANSAPAHPGRPTGNRARTRGRSHSRTATTGSAPAANRIATAIALTVWNWDSEWACRPCRSRHPGRSGPGSSRIRSTSQPGCHPLSLGIRWRPRRTDHVDACSGQFAQLLFRGSVTRDVRFGSPDRIAGVRPSNRDARPTCAPYDAAATDFRLRKRREKPTEPWGPIGFDALRHHSVGLTGFEPAASSSRTTRATKLRHSPKAWEVYPRSSRAPNRVPIGVPEARFNGDGDPTQR
jgi:hypothetical protein